MWLHVVCVPQLHSGDYAPYADASTSAGFAFLEYDILAGGGPLEVLVDAAEVSPRVKVSRSCDKFRAMLKSC
jgi:hypothetical protein